MFADTESEGKKAKLTWWSKCGCRAAVGAVFKSRLQGPIGPPADGVTIVAFQIHLSVLSKSTAGDSPTPEALLDLQRILYAGHTSEFTVASVRLI